MCSYLTKLDRSFEEGSHGAVTSIKINKYKFRGLQIY